MPTRSRHAGSSYAAYGTWVSPCDQRERPRRPIFTPPVRGMADEGPPRASKTPVQCSVVCSVFGSTSDTEKCRFSIAKASLSVRFREWGDAARFRNARQALLLQQFGLSSGVSFAASSALPAEPSPEPWQAILQTLLRGTACAFAPNGLRAAYNDSRMLYGLADPAADGDANATSAPSTDARVSWIVSEPISIVDRRSVLQGRGNLSTHFRP